ncbi:MAG: hypothetical protein IJW40_06630 [Clostridia bacterium]|nr:hypothetical protein [Clostridia bacterium]
MTFAQRVLIFILTDLAPLLLSLAFIIFIIRQQIKCAKDPFVCPNCGEKFYIKWWQLFVGRYLFVELTGKTVLTCPRCGQKDRCRWTGRGR